MFNKCLIDNKCFFIYILNIIWNAQEKIPVSIDIFWLCNQIMKILVNDSWLFKIDVKLSFILRTAIKKNLRCNKLYGRGVITFFTHPGFVLSATIFCWCKMHTHVGLFKMLPRFYESTKYEEKGCCKYF